VESAVGHKPAARASSRTLSASKAAAQVAVAWDEFRFLPPELVSACGVLVERYHARQEHPCKGPVEVVWRSDADQLLRYSRALKTLFGLACKTRRAQPAKKLQHDVAALILAGEVLVQDDVGWGARYPKARENAQQIFAKVSVSRAWLMETYGCPVLEKLH
jgi:hypothetical protein